MEIGIVIAWCFMYGVLSFVAMIIDLIDKYYHDADYQTKKKLFGWKDLILSALRGLTWPVLSVVSFVRWLKKKWDKRNKELPLPHRIVMKLLGEK